MATLCTSLTAQKPNPCGSEPIKSKWLTQYQLNPERYEIRSGEMLQVPLTLHIVGTDDGSAYISERRMIEAMKTLNEDFLPAEICFYIQDIRYINNSAWSNHGSVLDGADMMFANNVDNTINCYFMANAAGNCGYNLPYAGVAVSNNCAGADDHTWAHEIGHNLSLPHPFLGWEGGVSHDGSVPHNFNDPAPDFVTYDYTYFKSVPYRDTLIIDTAIVERVDGSNCREAADGFCDTKPDYLASRWQCGADSNSPTKQTDPAGEIFNSDGTLIMSYALDDCSNRFSEEQKAAMRANMIDQKSNYLLNPPTAEPIQEVVTLNYPLNGASVDHTGFELSWNPVQNATHYLVVTSLSSSAGSTFWDTITTQTTVIAKSSRVNRNLYWRVYPINVKYINAEPSEIGTFFATEIVHTVEPAWTAQVIVPSLIRQGDQLRINTKPFQGIAKATLLDHQGKVYHHTDIHQGNPYTTIPTDNILSGIYLMQITHERYTKTYKILVH